MINFPVISYRSSSLGSIFEQGKVLYKRITICNFPAPKKSNNNGFI